MVSILAQGELVEVDVNDFITMNDVVDMLNKHLNDFNYLEANKRLLVTATKCRSNINLKDLSEMDSINRKIDERYTELKIAVIVDDPIYTAICMVYEQLIKSFHYHFQVFSTKKAARRWLLQSEYMIE